ncbi:STAS domain-containing protein [Streptomyces sp. NPDC059525]|uniref:STAS domain-containing protein n=1 Tax=Streptomyces sp. NPDC059525 TaxID=3346857 RepID=UPI0036C5F485
MTGVTFCDGSGLHALLDVDQLAGQAGKTLALTALGPPVARLLHMSGVERVLTVRAQVLWVKHRRYGPTVHLTPVGRLNETTRGSLDEVLAALKDVDVVACDIQELTLLDLTSLNALIDLARRLNANGIALFTYNWQPRPRGDGGPVAVEVSRRPLPRSGRAAVPPPHRPGAAPGRSTCAGGQHRRVMVRAAGALHPAPLSTLCTNSD